MTLKVENDIVEPSEIVPLIEERLGNIDQIRTNYAVIIMPSKTSPEGDVLNSKTTDLRNLLNSYGIKATIAVKEPHKYLGLYSSDIILPTLAIIQNGMETLILSVIANIIYDKYIKRSGNSGNKLCFEYIRLNIKDINFERVKLEGSAKEVVEKLGNEGIKDAETYEAR